jgi:hypothetical protein
MKRLNSLSTIIFYLIICETLRDFSMFGCSESIKLATHLPMLTDRQLFSLNTRQHCAKLWCKIWSFKILFLYYWEIFQQLSLLGRPEQSTKTEGHILGELENTNWLTPSITFSNWTFNETRATTSTSYRPCSDSMMTATATIHPRPSHASTQDTAYLTFVCYYCHCLQNSTQMVIDKGSKWI